MAHGVALRMPLAPTGTRWSAAPTSEGWIVLRLGPVQWTDKQMSEHRPHTPGQRWPAVLPGLTAADTEKVIEMAHGLIARFRERFPDLSTVEDLVAAINHGQPLPVTRYPIPEPQKPLVKEWPQFEVGERVTLGKGGVLRVVVENTDTAGFVRAADATGKVRRCFSTAVVRGHA